MKCQPGEEIKVSQGLAAAPMGSEFHRNLLSLCTSASHPLGTIHQGLHLLSPALAELFPGPWVQASAAPPPAPSPVVPGCMGAHGDPYGCPQGHHLRTTGCTNAAAHPVVYSRLLPRAGAHREEDEELPPRLGRQGQHSGAEISLPHRRRSPGTRAITVTSPFPTGVFQKPSRAAATAPEASRTQDIPADCCQIPPRHAPATEELQVL